MITIGYNGYGRASRVFAELYHRTGIDQYRVLGHDPGAAIVVDGRLVAAAEEERFTRKKKSPQFPRQAIEFCLREAEVGFRDVDQFVFAWDFNEQVMAELIAEECACGNGAASNKIKNVAKLIRLYDGLLRRSEVIDELRQVFGKDIPVEKIRFCPHHLAHLLCGYHLSGIREAAFLVSDGRAEFYSSVMGEISRDGYSFFPECSISRKNSIGLFFSKVTRYLGFVPNNDEYKVMGLSSFEPPDDPNPFMKSVVRLLPNGTYELGIDHPLADDRAYYECFDELFKVPAGGRENFEVRTRIAANAQDVIERVTLHQIRELEKRSKQDVLLMEGGVALNCVNNQSMLRKSRFTDMRVGFASSDVGIAIGAAYSSFFENGVAPCGRISPYLGPGYSDAEIERTLQESASPYVIRQCSENELIDAVVELLAGGAVIGWFQGRMEYGPRALGNRSILANPSLPNVQDYINLKIKFRETFRPFAPIVSASDAAEVFEMEKKKDSPYMTFVFKVKERYRNVIAGAVHVDGTSRIQTVNETDNSRLHRLLTVFRDATGIPCLINTSFNVQGEPIVCSPRDALNCFAHTELDALVLNRFIVTKVSMPESPVLSPGKQEIALSSALPLGL